DGIERRDQPLRRACTGACVLRQERLASLADMEHDGPGFEEHEAVFLEDRHLPEGLQRAIVRLLLVALLEEPRPVRQTGLFQGPAHAQIAHLTPGEVWNPFEG